MERVLARCLEDAGEIVLVTGAGISAASGLRTYRGEGGLWAQEGTSAMTKATASYFIRNPEHSWAWHLARRTEALNATPNAAHDAIAAIESMLGDRVTVITQNIDRLHLRAGNTVDRTIEVHGHVDGMRCSGGCAGIVSIPEEFDGWTDKDTIGDEHRELLRCPTCGLVTRPHVLWFDEFYDEEHFRIRTAGRLAARSSVCITVGTSGGVPLAQRIAGIAARAGAVLIDVNTHDNDLRDLARSTPHGAVVDASATEALPEIASTVETLVAL